jgi:NSS family neurotransmitter:Na+ symporter
VLDLEDFIVSNNLLLVGSLRYLLFCTTRYGWGWDNFIAEANAGAGLKFPADRRARRYLIYVAPEIILAIFTLGYGDKFGAH